MASRRANLLRDRGLTRSIVASLGLGWWLAAAPACTLLVLIGLLAMPVSYRAGADVAHPHALVQLLTEASHGEIEHHHPPFGHPSASTPPRRLPRVFDNPWSNLPRLTETVPAIGRAPILAAPAALLLVGLFATVSIPKAVPPLLAQRRPWPEPPPPRRATLANR